MTKVYIASKLIHAPMLREWSSKWTEAQCTSSWLNIAGFVDDAPENAKTFWTRNFRDIQSAQCVVVYAEPGDKLRGALVEVGFAIANGMPIILLGEHEDYGTWQYSGAVYKARDMRHASWIIAHLYGE